MAQQLHYTSAPTGLENRAGFQFVAASRGATRLQQAVAPYLTYRPPPSAPHQPSPAELDALPVGFSFQRDGDQLILVQCRYLGTDYSGRYGNFLGHAVVALGRELGGLRPIELWGSPLWARTAGVATLPELSDLPAGSAVAPEEIMAWLAGRGEPAYATLGAVLDASLAGLDGRGGQVILVSERTDTLARWIAAVSYSLPYPDALRLSFVTYTADPDRARQHLVGTTADAVGSLRADAQLFEVDRGVAPANRSRYAEAVVAGWRRGSFELIEELFELVALGGEAGGGSGQAGRDAAALLIALSRGLARVERPEEAEAVAALLRRGADRLPAAVWSGLARQPGRQLGAVVAEALYAAAQRTHREDLADQVGAERVALAFDDRANRGRCEVRRLSAPRREALAGRAGEALREAADVDDVLRVVAVASDQGIAIDGAALRDGAARAVRAGSVDMSAAYDRLSGEERLAFLAGIVDGLATADGNRLRTVLTPALCDRLIDRDWSAAPRVGAYVLTSYGQRHAEQRVAVTESLVYLADRGGLSDGDLDRYVAAVWQGSRASVAECLRLIGPDGMVAPSSRSRPCLVDLARAALLTADIRRGETASLAHAVLGVVAGPAAADAEAVLAFWEIGEGDVAAGCGRFERVRGQASPDVVKVVTREALTQLVGAPPQHQAAALLALPAASPIRRDLVTALVRRRGGDVELAEVAVRLYLQGQPDEKLTVEVAARTKDQFHAHEVSLELRKVSRKLGENFDALRASAKQAGRISRLLRGGGDGA